jgi:hypothetical protein
MTVCRQKDNVPPQSIPPILNVINLQTKTDQEKNHQTAFHRKQHNTLNKTFIITDNSTSAHSSVPALRIATHVLLSTDEIQMIILRLPLRALIRVHKNEPPVLRGVAGRPVREPIDQEIERGRLSVFPHVPVLGVVQGARCDDERVLSRAYVVDWVEKVVREEFVDVYPQLGAAEGENERQS